MKINVRYPYDHLAYPTKHLLSRMLGPLCGIDHEIGLMLRSSQDSHVIVAGAEMAGVHTLMNLPHPGRGAYHLGACGTHLNEAIIKTLGETVERYSQVISEVSGLNNCIIGSYQEMLQKDNKVLPFDAMSYFISHQYYQQNFPFDTFDFEQPITWVKLQSLLRRDHLWVPAQLVFVGYRIKREKHEPWIASAVTTGTAAHTNQNQALINSMMELIQIDSAMGHWYTAKTAPKIEFDDRTVIIERLLSKYARKQKTSYSFHYLHNPDLPGFSIACVYRNNSNSYPKCVVGLGSDLTLSKAMYKAFLEAVGIIGLARMIIFDNQYHLSQNTINPRSIYDLNTNVAYYALGNQKDFIAHKYPINITIPSRKLPPDITLRDDEAILFLLNEIAMQKKEILFYDLTTVEAQRLGFVVPRVWSPDLLPLSLPSAPFLNSKRYNDFGGVQHEQPHPYP